MSGFLTHLGMRHRKLTDLIREFSNACASCTSRKLVVSWRWFKALVLSAFPGKLQTSRCHREVGSSTHGIPYCSQSETHVVCSSVGLDVRNHSLEFFFGRGGDVAPILTKHCEFCQFNSWSFTISVEVMKNRWISQFCQLVALQAPASIWRTWRAHPLHSIL